MNTETNFDLLDKISEKNNLSEKDLEILIELSKNEDEEIRSYVAELLVLSDEDSAKKTLIQLCSDTDELVRVNACDSLFVFAEFDVYKILYTVSVKDESELVKSYALLSIIDIMAKIDIDKNQLEELFSSNLNSDIAILKITSCKGLYLLGFTEYLNKLIDFLNAEDYQDRCFALNTLPDIVNADNYNQIISTLVELKRIEKTEAVLSTLENIVNDIEEIKTENFKK